MTALLESPGDPAPVSSCRTALADVPAPPPTADKPQARSAEYEHLIPLLLRYTALAGPGSERDWLREELILGYEPLTRHLARRHAGRFRDVEPDLVQVGMVGLITALDRFSPERLKADGDPLSYLIPCIRGEILRWFRDKSWAMRVPRRLKDLSVAINRATGELTARLDRAPRPSELAAHLGVEVGEVVEALTAQLDHSATSLDADTEREDGRSAAETIGFPERAFDAMVDSMSVKPLIEALPERERAILRLRFFEEMTQSQIAAELGISQMHVSRLLARTLQQLRTAVA
ncbi:SigB/SigF/SigG family RNA polymerase sigma factor [Pseudonocardia ailaonensis]|uniref:SigB/SigF/SigG family RNA polymerase sigma factor n=1 Tax=Pseudonocardia ailaonensis TaxID=367279 RepID=A0ABN2MKF6_9PSEU